MRLTILSQGFKPTDAIMKHVEGRIQLALGTAFDRIDSVSVRLSDINADHGGVDKRCRIVVGLRGGRGLVVQAVHTDLYAAVDDAAGRAKETLWRHLKRRRTLRRQYASRPLQRQLA